MQRAAGTQGATGEAFSFPSDFGTAPSSALPSVFSVSSVVSISGFSPD